MNRHSADSFQPILNLSVAKNRSAAAFTAPLCAMAMMVIVAKMAGKEDLGAIKTFIALNRELLERTVGLSKELPSQGALRKVQAIMEPAIFVELGKRMLQNDPCIHEGDEAVISAVLSSVEYGLALTADKIDDLEALERSLLDLTAIIRPRRCIISLCNIVPTSKLLDTITWAGADFVLQLNEDCGQLHAQTHEALHHRTSNNASLLSSYAIDDADPNASKESSIHLLPAAEVFSEDVLKAFPAVYSVFKVNDVITGHDANETYQMHMRYFISSVAPDFEDKDFGNQMLNVLPPPTEDGKMTVCLDFEQDRLPLRSRDYMENQRFFSKLADCFIVYAQNALQEQGLSVSKTDLRQKCCDAATAFEILKAGLLKDKSLLQEESLLSKLDLRNS